MALVVRAKAAATPLQFSSRIPVGDKQPSLTLNFRRPLPLSKNKLRHCADARRSGRWHVHATAALSETALYAKEMERVAAKEALLLAIKDAGGAEGLTSGKGSSAAKIEVAEKVLALERLNPTPRPTTSPLLEGFWEFRWAGARSPGVLAARFLLRQLPKEVASIDSLVLAINEGTAVSTASVKLLSSVGTTFTISSRLSFEGPIRLKEEYSEGVLSSPVVMDEDIPAPLKSVYGGAASVLASLPDSIKETLQAGITIPLAGTYTRELLISYLDDEVLVARNDSGVPDVLVRIVSEESSADGDTTYAPEYES